MNVHIDYSKFRISRMEEWEKIEESFNCGDTDLSDFILHEAPLYREALLAVSYVASPLLSKDNDEHTRLYYYDLLSLFRSAIHMSSYMAIGSSLIIEMPSALSIFASVSNERFSCPFSTLETY